MAEGASPKPQDCSGNDHFIGGTRSEVGGKREREKEREVLKLREHLVLASASAFNLTQRSRCMQGSVSMTAVRMCEYHIGWLIATE